MFTHTFRSRPLRPRTAHRAGVAVLALAVLSAGGIVASTAADGQWATQGWTWGSPESPLAPSAPDQFSGAAPDSAAPGTVDPTPGTPAEAPVEPAWCPTQPLAPDPDRPVVTLRFDVSQDRRVVTGVEKVSFVPDARVSELVFRLWPNAPVSAARGAALDVTKVTVGGRALSPVGGTDPTLLEVRLPQARAAGTRITAELTFRLQLPAAGQDRYGASADVAWWGTGHPLLAWVDGQGWQRDPAPAFPGEGAVSEAAVTDVTVVTPDGDTVVTAGPVTEVPLPAGAAPGMRAWHATSAVARDVSVVAGRMEVRDTVVTGVPVAPGVTTATPDAIPVRVAVAAGAVAGDGSSRVAALDSVTELAASSIRRMTPYLGTFPYASLGLVVLPGLGASGIEYPGTILLGNDAWRHVVPHEVAHQWFYGMVGDNQSRDPWLDESFATYLESAFNRSGMNRGWVDMIEAPMGSSVAHYGDLPSYVSAVYLKGGGALVTARLASGTAFDVALRCYVRANAWTVAEPDDVATAFADVPDTMEVLRRAGALR